MKRFLITIALLITATVTSYAFSRPEAIVTRRPLKEFPNVIGDWSVLNEQLIEDSAMAVLLVDDYIMRTYANKKGETIGLYIGYFKSQREGKQVHSPRQCLPGAGWHILSNSEYMLELKEHNPSKAPVNLYLMGKDDRRQLIIWCYQGRGRIYANEYLNKLYLIWDAMTKNRTDGALMRISMLIKSNPDQTLATEVDFIDQILPILSQYIPK